MIRPSNRLASLTVLVALVLPVAQAMAQQQVPPAPEASAPTPTAAPIFPQTDPANFTASSPSKETVNAFLQTNWGYDEDRVWQVQAILKTSVEGISKVVVFLGDKTGKQKPTGLQFFALPDGKHIIAGDEILAFGVHPYADQRALLQQHADGPYRGSASKDLELVEFADFQCPHCKEAQPNMEKLVADFPKARIVFENYPLPQHPAAFGAASYGVCVGKQGGSDAFFNFAAAVFDGQDGLNTPDGATLTLNSAVTKVGLDPVKIAACAATPATKAIVDSSIQLAKDIGISQTPVLMVNGRQVPIGGISYDVVKTIIEYQEKLDGITK